MQPGCGREGSKNYLYTSIRRQLGLAEISSGHWRRICPTKIMMFLPRPLLTARSSAGASACGTHKLFSDHLAYRQKITKTILCVPPEFPNHLPYLVVRRFASAPTITLVLKIILKSCVDHYFNHFSNFIFFCLVGM
jgi:hypothetical protein